MHPILSLFRPLPSLACVALMLSAADGGEESPVLLSRPFIWVRDSEIAGILDKIANHAWAASVFDGMVSRVAADVASHQSNRDAFLRELPVNWTQSPAKFKTIPAYSEASVRYAAEQKLNVGVDCAVLHYLTGDEKYARCAADILHNAVKTLLPVATSTDVGNGGWVFQDDFLKEARVSATQLPIIYDFLHTWLQSNQVHDVQTAGMVNFNFTNAQSVFRTFYQLARDHGSKNSNWSALMSTAMLNNLLALDDDTERAAAVQVYLATGSSRQASLDYDYRNYDQPGDIWPESLQYAAAVGNIRSTHMVLLERYDPSLNLFGSYPNFLLSLPRISQLRYPNGEQILFGDGTRNGTNGPFFIYELVYQHALARGRTDLTSYFGSLINGAVAEGKYNRSTLNPYDNLGTQNDPLQLLWQAPVISEAGVTPEVPRTDRLPFAGVALQRNPAPANNTTYGLMCFVGGAGHIHSHASGMSMEIFGMGEVMGAKSGRSTYQSALHENYYRLFASNNTIIVNGGSRGEGGWESVGINSVQTVAMEPRAQSAAVSPDFSFTCSSFADDRGTLADATQQRTMAIVRTSARSGFYVDLFRSKSTVTSRTAITLNGSVTDQYHDYIYRNIGETTVDMDADGAPLPLFSQANRFQNDIGDSYDQPGWRYFTNPLVSQPTSASFRARFVATVSGTARHMDMHMPAVASREYVKVDSPAIVDAPSPYDSRPAPAVVVRQIGEAWDKAFAAVYEPRLGSVVGTVQNVMRLLRGSVVVGVKIESVVNGNSLVHYVMANPDDGETYTDPSIGLSFTGRFGIAADLGDGNVTLYLGQGSSISYGGNLMTTVNGSSSQAEARFVPGEDPVVTSNTPVNAVAAAFNTTWIPTAGGALDWTHAANWLSTFWPDDIGAIARMGIDIDADQTVNVNAPVTLGELVVGDRNGGQATTLQKGTVGSLTFDQPDAAVAYLTRADGGTGTVTLAGDLDIMLEDDLTVRPAADTADSTIVIAGNLSGAGKSLVKEGGNFALVLSGDNSHSGMTRISGGLLRSDSANALGSGNLVLKGGVLGLATGDFTRQLGTGAGQLDWNPGSGGFAAFGADREVRLNNGTGNFSWSSAIIGGGNTLILGHPSATHTLDFRNGISFAGSKRTVQVEDGAAAVDAVLSGVLSGGNSSGFIKTGGGVLSLANANTYSGATTINGGVLRLQHADALPSGNLELVGGILGLGADDMTDRAIGTGTGQVQWTGSGGFAAFGAGRSVKFSDSSINWNAANFIGTNRTLVLGHETADATLDWQQRISLAGNPRVIRVDDGSTMIDAKMSGSVAGGTSGGTSNVFIKTGSGTLAFTSQNTYWGDTIVSAGTLMIGDGGDTGGVSQNSPNIIVESGATLALNRSDTLTQGTNPLKVAISGGGNFAQAGPGTTTLTLSNTYTGATIVSSGILALGADHVLPDTSPVTIGNATLDAAAFSETAGSLGITGNAILRLEAGGTLVFADSHAVDWGGGTLRIEGAFVSGMSIRFGDGSGDGLSAGQLSRISAAGFANFGINGSGFLTADTVGASGFETWKTVNGTTGGLDDDHDGDGVTNGVDYFVGGPNGNTTGITALPGVTNIAGVLSVTFTKAADYTGVYGTDFVVETSATLAPPWTAEIADPNPGFTVTFPSATEVKYTFPAGTKNFARLKVTGP